MVILILLIDVDLLLMVKNLDQFHQIVLLNYGNMVKMSHLLIFMINKIFTLN